MMKDMPSSNAVWGAYLHGKGFKQYAINDDDCTISEFCRDNYGECILATGTHVVAVIDDVYYDSWDSGNEIATSYWRKE